MLDRSSVKTMIERIHLDYLCNNFNLLPFLNSDFQLNGIKPDLFGKEESPTCLFELKSRVYPKKQSKTKKRLISQFGWWHLDEDQIRNYEELGKNKGFELFWIFLLGHIEKQLTEYDNYDNLDEDIIKHRDIFVVPWCAYDLVVPAKANMRYIGLSRLKKEYGFLEKEVKKGKLSIVDNILDKVDKYFV